MMPSLRLIAGSLPELPYLSRGRRIQSTALRNLAPSNIVSGTVSWEVLQRLGRYALGWSASPKRTTEVRRQGRVPARTPNVPWIGPGSAKVVGRLIEAYRALRASVDERLPQPTPTYPRPPPVANAAAQTAHCSQTRPSFEAWMRRNGKQR